jgi:hypothetical protein
MDQQDQSDIIAKVKSSTTNSGGDNDIDLDSEAPAPESNGEEGDIDLSDIDMEESHNPNGNGKTVFQDMTLGVKDGGMEENKYLNLENYNKSSIFEDKKTIKEMVKESLRTEREPVTQPSRTKPVTQPSRTKPVTQPSRRETREGKPWRVKPNATPEPKANLEEGMDSIQYIDSGRFVGNEGSEEVEITFDVGNVRFVETFRNTGEILEKPMAYDEPWIYSYETDVLSNGKQYGVSVEYFGHPQTNLDLVGFDSEIPEIEEI